MFHVWKKADVTLIFKEGKEEEIRGTTGWSASPWSLGRSWNKKYWKVF